MKCYDLCRPFVHPLYKEYQSRKLNGLDRYISIKGIHDVAVGCTAPFVDILPIEGVHDVRIRGTSSFVDVLTIEGECNVGVRGAASMIDTDYALVGIFRCYLGSNARRSVCRICRKEQ